MYVSECNLNGKDPAKPIKFKFMYLDLLTLIYFLSVKIKTPTAGLIKKILFNQVPNSSQ